MKNYCLFISSRHARSVSFFFYFHFRHFHSTWIDGKHLAYHKLFLETFTWQKIIFTLPDTLWKEGLYKHSEHMAPSWICNLLCHLRYCRYSKEYPTHKCGMYFICLIIKRFARNLDKECLKCRRPLSSKCQPIVCRFIAPYLLSFLWVECVYDLNTSTMGRFQRLKGHTRPLADK